MIITCSRRSLLAGSVITTVGSLLPSPFAVAAPLTASTELDVSDPEFWYGAFRKLTLTGLDAIPGLGGILSGFGTFLLPLSLSDPEDARWRRFVDAINKITDEKIDTAIYNSVSAHLSGITRQLRIYKGALESGDQAHMRSVEDAMNVYMQGILPQFMEQGPRYRLLPLFAPAANIHLGLLRQAAQRARRNGETPVADDYAKQLDECIEAYGHHYDTVLEEQLPKEISRHPHDHDKNRSQPWAAVLAWKSRQQLCHGDMRTCWSSFSERRYPDAVRPRLDREIFTPLFGSYYDCKRPFPDFLPSHNAPKGPITTVRIGGYNFVDGMELNYFPSHGPDDTDSTVIGGEGGEWISINDVGARKHITAIEVGSGYAVNQIRLTFGDGSKSAWVGGGRPSDPATLHAFDGHRLSSVMGFGTAAGYGGVLSGCVFGFQLLEMQASHALGAPVRQHIESVWPQALARG